MRLYRVEVEAEVYCLAESQHEAMVVARERYLDEEPVLTAYEASYVATDWHDEPPYHRRSDLPDKTCAEWMRELNEAPGG